jgi:hypothetical protein
VDSVQIITQGRFGYQDGKVGLYFEKLMEILMEIVERKIK